MIKLKNKNQQFQNFVVIGIILLLTLFFSIKSPMFRRYTTVVTLFNYMYYILLMSIGVTFPLITGGVDLSIGTGVVCYSIVGSHMFNHLGYSVGVGILVTVLMGTFVGFLNGLIISKLKIPPFITTLCTMMAVRGLGSIITGGLPGLWPNANQEGGWVRNILRQEVNGTIIPTGILWLFILMIIMTIILRKTQIGRYTIAIGSNREALHLSGIAVDKWHIIAYTISGLFAGLAALAFGWTFTTIMPGTGAGFEMDAIGGAIIGGVSTTGGKGSIFGAFLGVLLISILKTGLPFIGLQANWQQIITGFILIFAVTIDVMNNKEK